MCTGRAEGSARPEFSERVKLRSALPNGERDVNYEFRRRRRTRPPTPSSPVPTRNRLAGSGVLVVGVHSGVVVPTTAPVLLIFREQAVPFTPCRWTQAKVDPGTFVPVNVSVTVAGGVSPLLMPLVPAQSWKVARFPMPEQLVVLGSMVQPVMAGSMAPPLKLAYPPMPTAVNVPVLVPPV